MTIHIYSPIGLRELASYLDELIEGKNARFRSQNHLAEIAGVPANTLKSIRMNRYLGDTFKDGEKYHKPSLETILALAPHLPDPMTGKPFDPAGKPCRLEAVIRGWEPLRNPGQKWKPIAASHPYAKAIVAIQQAYALNPKAFAESGLTDGTLERLCSGERPTIDELIMLQDALSIPLREVLDLYGIDPKKPLPNGAGKNGKQDKS